MLKQGDIAIMYHAGSGTYARCVVLDMVSKPAALSGNVGKARVTPEPPKVPTAEQWERKAEKILRMGRGSAAATVKAVICAHAHLDVLELFNDIYKTGPYERRIKAIVCWGGFDQHHRDQLAKAIYVLQAHGYSAELYESTDHHHGRSGIVVKIPRCAPQPARTQKPFSIPPGRG